MKTSELVEKKVSREEIFHGTLLHVTRDMVEQPNGVETTRECIWHPGAVVMIPILHGETLIMERQFRYPPNQIFLEFPAGKLDPGEDHLSCGKRELIEETGYEAHRWDLLTRLHPAAAYSDELMKLFVARDLEYVGINRDADEFLEVIEVELTDALKLVHQGHVSDVKTMAGIFWAEKILRGGWEPHA